MNYAVIMAGGSGKRLWPLSRKNRPKQIIDLLKDQSLLQHSVDRIKPIFSPEQIMVVTNNEYAQVVSEHLPDIPRENIIGEPIGRDTSNAIGLAATVLSKRDPSSNMAVFSADQIIEPHEPLIEAIQRAFEFLEKRPEALFTFGIKASYAHTGLGYLKKGEESDILPGVFPVDAFKEKPNKNTASAYIRSGDYCWNSGMFVWKTSTILKQIDRFLPHNSERLDFIGHSYGSPEWDKVLNSEFGKLEKISIDYGVMERAKDVYMCQLDCHWEDVGSYETLSETIGILDEHKNSTVLKSTYQQINSFNNIIISGSEKHLIATINVDDLVVVHTSDATLICHRDETDRLKELIDKIHEADLSQFT